MKLKKYETPKGILKDTKVSITNEGKRYLRAVLGMKECRNQYVITRVNECVNKFDLKKIAKFYLQDAYCTFTSSY